MMSLKFDSVEHEVIYNKLLGFIKNEDISHEHDLTKNEVKQKYLEEIHSHINVMLKSRENYAHRHLFSHRKIMGRFIVFIKKIIRKLLKWYIDPIAIQQTEFNNAVTPVLGRTAEILIELISQNNEFEQQMITLINNNNSLEHKLASLSHDLELQRKHNGELEEEQNNNVKQIETLLEMNRIYSEQVELANEKINKIDEIGLFNNVETSFFIKSTYSQAGEDSILAYIFRFLRIPIEEIDYIDLGANHAKEMSNSYYFYKRGAKGVLVEANPKLIPELKFYRHRDVILNNCIDISSGNEVDFYVLSGDGVSTTDLKAAEKFCEISPELSIVDKIKVKTITYEDIVRDYLGKTPTILSIDIEGKDDKILKSIDFEHSRPLVIIVEMIEYSTKLSYNTKNNSISEFMNSVEYDEYAFTGINSIFIDKRFLKERQL